VDDSLSGDVERAAHALALDVTAVDVVEAFTAVGIPSVILKGPGTAHWLHAEDPASRTYTDVDVLVDPHRFEEAERVLASMTYSRVLSDYRDGVPEWSPESAWQRPGSPPTSVDLHRGFHGAGDRESFWAVMDANTSVLDLAGRPVRIPDRAGCALITALHDSAAGRTEQSGDDLRRALSRLDDDVWREAARRAEAVDALPSMVVGIGLHDEGRQLIARLGLAPQMPAEVAIRGLVSSGADAGTVEKAWLLQQRLDSAAGWTPWLRSLLELAFPSADYLRATQALANRGRLGLLASRVLRPARLLLLAPRVLRAVVAGRRASRRS
jgi:hypothetical protein